MSDEKNKIPSSPEKGKPFEKARNYSESEGLNQYKIPDFKLTPPAPPAPPKQENKQTSANE